MKHFEIHHQVGIQAKAEEIYQALTEPRKLAQWWTSDTRGEGARVGGVLEFWFGEFCQKFEVTELEPGRRVRWRSRGGMGDWEGTEVRFELAADEAQCWVHFVHSGWREMNEMFAHCSTKWAVFMLSLKDLLEKGRGRPVPDDIEINHD